MSRTPAAARRLDPWERFARVDPLAYILSSHDGDEQRFWQTGRDVAARIFADVEPLLPGRERVVEVGCGAGRVLIPISRHFAHAAGTDVSPTMLDLLRRYAVEQGAAGRIRAFLPDGAWDSAPADLVFSTRVFRHIDDRSIVDQYVQRIAATLRPGGVAHLQFNTRPITRGYVARNRLPDLVLPKHWKRGARGIRMPRRVALEMVERHGLTVHREISPRTDVHDVIAVRP